MNQSGPADRDGSTADAPSALPLSRILAHHAERDPDRASLVFGDRVVSRLALDRLSNRLARAYQALGVGPNDLVTICLPNSVDFFVAVFAAWKCGAVPNVVSHKLPGPEFEAIITLANPALIVGGKPGQAGERPHLPEGFEPDPGLSDGQLEAPVPPYWKVMTSGGSTGRPKLIVDHMPASFPPTRTMMAQQVDGVILCPGPLYHNGPFVCCFYGLFTGNQIVVMDRFDPEAALTLIDRFMVDWVHLVPTMMNRIWRLPEATRARHDLSSLRTMLHMAAPCPAWLKVNWIEWLGPDRIVEVYGATEGRGATWISGREWLEHRGSVGRPVGGCAIRILGEDGSVLPAGEIGEIYALPKGGQNATYHYLGAEAKSADGWESSGDMGYFDADGYLYLVDRRTDLVISGGANIYPAEVEAVIDAFPGVKSSVGIGLPDDDLGQRLHAIVEVDDGSPIDGPALLAFLTEHIAKYKLPRSFEFVRYSLRDEAGKVRRSKLREERLPKGG